MDRNAGIRKDFEEFWALRADELLQWSRPWKEVCSGDFRSGSVAWFRGGQLNASVNCLDRHLSCGRRNKAALIGQGENDREVRADIATYCPAATLDATAPLFVLYTSGVTGPPRPVTHGIGGYLVHALHSCREVFAPGEDDIFWCTADIGWITGHSYSVYGPLGLDGTVLQVGGHRLGTAEIEAALLAHPSVVEAAVVGIPDDEKGEAVYAYVTPHPNVAPTWRLLEDLRQHLARAIGPLATPEIIQFAPALPKTRSGKIIRHLLKKFAADDLDAIGDLSALADPSVVTVLMEGKPRASSKL
jgi:acyl-coenzyme A synthetase/AMP-(fatty) acid ligase